MKEVGEPIYVWLPASKEPWTDDLANDLTNGVTEFSMFKHPVQAKIVEATLGEEGKYLRLKLKEVKE